MVNQTEHAIVVEDARTAALPEGSVDLIVTSPPYPMIEMWDGVFSEMDPSIETALANGDALTAFERMHTQLDRVWETVGNAVKDGGFICVNIGDATRTVDGVFQGFQNAARVIEAFREKGFHTLPRLYWQKPTNSGTAFMGSGTLPPNAYPTLEHEHILLFRKGEPKTFEPNDPDRYESAYFFEERNEWFSDHWDDVTGVSQSFIDVGSGEGSHHVERDRTAAYPLEIPYRLINMFSLYGDVVLDPFGGTGTTTIASMLTGRNSVSVEIDPEVAQTIRDRVGTVPEQARRWIETRIDAHRQYIDSRKAEGNPVSYDAEHYPFGVVSQQERQIRFYEPTSVTMRESGASYETLNDVVSGSDIPVGFVVAYEPYSGGVPVRLDRFIESDERSES